MDITTATTDIINETMSISNSMITSVLTEWTFNLSTSTNPSSIMPTTGSKNGGRLSGGAIVGIVIGSIIGVVLLAFGAIAIYRFRYSIVDSYRKKTKRQGERQLPRRVDFEIPPAPLRSTTTSRLVNSHRSSIRPSIEPSRLSMVDGGNNQQVVLSFHNISYTVENNQQCKVPFLGRKQKQTSKQILFDVSGLFESGMNALLGPTGCGKSSLLDILAARKDPRGLSGRVLADGSPLPKSYKYMVGYVVQDDILSGTLTVRENLAFSANVRLPKTVSTEERQRRITEVIREMGLEACVDTRIGTEFLRGVSGGERKRTCIGMELVLAPKILFLDEPTTGLDASTAHNVMTCLHRLSRKGRTIVFSIHQPRYSIFKLFDNVVFLCKGKCIYQGSSKGALPYFTAQGYPCEEHDNPADFALDVLIQASKTTGTLPKLARAYMRSPMYEHISTRVADLEPNENEIYCSDDERPEEANRSLITEIFYVAQRTLRNSIRNPQLALSQIVVAVVIGLLVGLVFFDMDRTTNTGVQNRLGAIFFIVVSQVFSTVTALEPLLKERVLFIHENVSGYYRTSTFFIAKLVCDLLPMRIIPSIVFSIIAYFMTGLQRTVGQFMVFLLTIFMATVFGSAMCFLFSACIPLFAVALIGVVLVFVVMMVFSGFLVDLATVFPWLSWIQWISAFRYASNVLTINEFRHLILCETINMTDVCLLTGEEVLDQRDLDHANDWDMWKNFLGLSIMAIGFLALAYIQLVRIKKTK